MDTINGRRSVRNFTPQKVPAELIRELIKAAVQAPSAMNSQPWSFVIIQDATLLKNYSDQAKQILLANLDQQPLLAKYRATLANPDYNIFYNAGTLLIIYARPAGPHPLGDCSLAAQNIMLTAHARGLGTCWIGFAVALLDTPAIKRSLNIPAEYTAVAPLIVGFPQFLPPAVPRNDPEILAWK